MSAVFKGRRRKKPKKKLIVAGLVLFSVFVLGRGAYKYFNMKNHRDDMSGEIASLKKENKKLQKRIKNVYSDEEYIEKIAREQLNLVKKGETVYIISDE